MTIKGRDLPDIDDNDKVRFFLVHGQELEAVGYCKNTVDMRNRIITIYLKLAEDKEEE